MGIRSLASLKKKVEEKSSFIECDSLIYGGAPYSFSLYKKLTNQNVLILSDHPLTPSDLRIKGPTAIRTKGLASLCNERGVETTPFSMESCFYKDLKFRQFSSRAKSEKLQSGEELFVGTGHSISSHLYDDPTGLEQFQSKVISKFIGKINALEDGVEVVCTDGLVIKCKNLYWGESATLFLDKFSGRIDDSFATFAQTTKAMSSFEVELRFNKVLDADHNTVFIPLSYTHEWGHFVGDWKNENDGTSSINFLHFVEKDDSTEDELSKRLRILKKSLEKIYPDFLSAFVEEKICFKEFGMGFALADSEFFKSEFSKRYPMISLFGENAPLEVALTYPNPIVGQARALLSLSTISTTTA